MKVINIFSGPGSGKSTTAALLFSKLKRLDKKVEYVSEFAKDLTYEKSYKTLEDYLYILAQQHHMLYRLKDEVDYVICDGSFLMGYVYHKKSSIYDEKLFKQLIIDIFYKYDNINFFLNRENITYQNYGRTQTLEDALALDNKILDMLKKEKIEYSKINTKNATKKIIKKIL